MSARILARKSVSVSWKASFREDKEVEFDDCGDDFEDQTRRRRHDHTVDKRVLLAAGGKHCVDENGVLQQLLGRNDERF